jgi:hypothetical protein
MSAEAADAAAMAKEFATFALGVGSTDGQPEAPHIINGTKLEILLPALLPLVGPGAITPTE